MPLNAPSPALGFYEEGYEHVAAVFARQLEEKETGASLCVIREGRPVLHLWGGVMDKETQRPWESDTRIVVFSATKGLSAMAYHLAHEQKRFEWDAPVATYWPAFAQSGKAAITVRQLLNHAAGLAVLDTPLSIDDCVDPNKQDAVRKALEVQAPRFDEQGYHATTWGLYASTLFEEITGEDLGAFLKRELFEVVGSDVRLGDSPDLDAKTATLYSPELPRRAAHMARRLVFAPRSAEALILREMVRKSSLPRQAFSNPAPGKEGPLVYNSPKVRRHALTWASGTASAHGVATAYAPFANGGAFQGKQLFSAESLRPIYERQSWSFRDKILQKPLGWSQGFLKEERHIFCPNTQSFGHAGMGGSMGWADPATKTAWGYVMNAMDWRVRSERAVRLCRALYECEPLAS